MLKDKLNLCVLISGRGSNLLSIIKSCRKKDFPAKVRLVVSNKPKAPGLQYAKKYNIPFKVITKNFEKNIVNQLANHSIDVICLAVNTHQRALNNKEKYSGCTVHYVTEKLDSGNIILQKKVKITKNETKESLEAKILKEEHILYPQAIRKIYKEHYN